MMDNSIYHLVENCSLQPLNESDFYVITAVNEVHHYSKTIYIEVGMVVLDLAKKREETKSKT